VTLKTFNIGYKYENKRPRRIKTCNNFSYKDIDTESNEDEWGPYGPSPYEPSKETKPALFLGFERDIAGTPITLYFAVRDWQYGEDVKKIPCSRLESSQEISETPLSLTWKYFNGRDWVVFHKHDEAGLFRAGMAVSFLAPADIKKKVEFEQDLFWLKIVPGECEWLPCPMLMGVFPNTVQAVNAVTIRDEVSGSGTGQPGLSLSFTKKPILEGQVIEVNEKSVPSKDEQSILRTEEGPDAVRLARDEAGEIRHVWIRWHQVRDFSLSDPLSRHYVLDRTNGTITFGDGARGMAVPNGVNNIVAREYRSGSGKRGNKKAVSIKALKTTIPGIDHVLNHVPAFGGVDQEDIENAVNRGPHTIKNRNRAVTREDFEWLACEASQDVVRSRCIMDNNAAIRVIIVPHGEEMTPLPKAGMINSVENYLKERVLVTLRNRIEVVGPEYKTIDIEVTVKPDTPGEGVIVRERIKDRLEQYLHPIKGGQDGKGWKPGQNIFISEVANIVEGIMGVDYIEGLRLKKVNSGKDIKEVSGAERGWINIEDNALPCTGRIDVKFWTQIDTV